MAYVLPEHPFDGLEVGAEVLYARVENPRYEPQLDPSNDGVAIGPFAGYKVITCVGFTFVAQFGFQYVTARAHPYALDSSGRKVSKGYGPVTILDLDVGWSW